MAKTKPQLQSQNHWKEKQTNQRLQNIERDTGSTGCTIPTRWPLVAVRAESRGQRRRSLPATAAVLASSPSSAGGTWPWQPWKAGTAVACRQAMPHMDGNSGQLQMALTDAGCVD